jgi:sodium-coupled monocarboxylate transporter 8/12
MVLPVFISFPFIFRHFLPFYHRLRLYNCYEYLERRFDVRVRVTATALFILWRLAWMGTTIYLPAYVLNAVMGWDLLFTIILLGLITTVYTTMGGVRGVIWTDVVQAFIMFAGLVFATWLVVSKVPGGLPKVWSVSREAGFMYFTAKIPEMAQTPGLWDKISLYFHADLTFWSIIVVGTLSKLTSYGCDQVMVQRYLTAKSMQDSKRGFVINSIAYVIYSLLFILLGMGLFTYFELNPLPEGTKYEYMFPYFIDHFMPVLVTGLIIAAIYSAAQSSVSSGITAVTAAIFSDLYLRLVKGQQSVDESAPAQVQKGYVWFSRGCALALGIGVTLFACLIRHLHANESLFAVFNKVVGSFAGLIIPIFVLGMFSRRAESLGVCLGAVLGFAATYYWAFHTELGYGWTACVAFVVIVVVTYVISLFGQPPSPEKLQWTWKSIMERPETNGGKD